MLRERGHGNDTSMAGGHVLPPGTCLLLFFTHYTAEFHTCGATWIRFSGGKWKYLPPGGDGTGEGEAEDDYFVI